jgi:enterochelin esterase family protein
VGTSPTVEVSAVVFELADRRRRLAGVRLIQEIGQPGPLDFARVTGAWRLSLPLPEVDRMEYLFEVRDHHGHRTTITDPGNPRRAPGAFGEKSVLEFAAYHPPPWLLADAVPGVEAIVEVDGGELGGPLTATLWAPEALAVGEPAPLVVVNDGPEFASLGGLTHYLGTAIAAGTVPPLRAALLDPGDRNDWYSANPAYAHALCTDLLPRLDDVTPATVRVGVGVSLGGLAMLHAHRTYPDVFDALLLQSGSFFTPILDPQEADFSGFAAVSEFVTQVHEATSDAHPVPTVLTCGTVEENLENNAAMVHTLQRLGYPARLALFRDAHNFTAWRDSLDPQLSDLVMDVVGTHAT